MRTSLLPVLLARPRVFDPFDADTLSAYTTSGTWAISTGRLRNVTAGDGQSCLHARISRPNMRVSAVVRTSATNRYPCLALRATDASNMVFILVGTTVIRVYDRVAGVDTQLGADITVTVALNTDYTISADIVGQTVTVTFAGVNYTRTTTRTGAGMGGVRLGSSSGALEVQFDDLRITAL